MKTLNRVWQLLNLAICASVFIMLSCKKDDTTNPNPRKPGNCEFVQNDKDMDGLIDDNERKIMIDCYANQMISKSEIEANLIGEWELIGHGEGWISTVSQPCGYVTISKDELIFDFDTGYYDSVTVHSWELVKLSEQIYALETKPVLGAQFYMTTFCDDYMYHDGTPYDANMSLYHKVK